MNKRAARQETVDTAVETQPRRGRKRSAEADLAILTATREILLETGYVGFTIQAVVERSGVSTATIYRRWNSANDLILAAMTSLVPATTPIDTGSFATDLERFIDYLAEALLSLEAHAKADKKDSRIDPELRRAIADMFIQPRISMLAEIIERALRRGDIKSAPPTERFWPYVAGPLHHHLIIESKPYSHQYAAEVKAVIAAGFAVLAAR